MIGYLINTENMNDYGGSNISGPNDLYYTRFHNVPKIIKDFLYQQRMLSAYHNIWGNYDTT